MTTKQREPSQSLQRTVAIRVLDTSGLNASAELSRERFGFKAEDQIPPWLMHTTNQNGGLALGGYVDGRLVGYSYAIPGFGRNGPFLFSCGLAVAPGFESQGIGEALKLAQRRHARQAGYEIIRWTTGSLASRSLYLYLSKLGARLVRYHEDMYRDVLGSFFPDEVEIEWDLKAVGPAPRAEIHMVPVLSSEIVEGDVRHLVRTNTHGLTSLVADAYGVELPWDLSALRRHHSIRAKEWMMGVRQGMQHLLAGGYVGTAVVVDRSSRRPFVRFDRAPPTSR